MIQGLEEYYTFSIEKLIRDIPRKKQRLLDAKATLSEIDSIKGSGHLVSPDHATTTADSVGMTVIDKSDLEAEISRLEWLIDLYEKGYNKLTGDDKLIIDTFFQGAGCLLSNVDFLADEIHVERSEVYRRRRKALDTMRNEILA